MKHLEKVCVPIGLFMSDDSATKTSQRPTNVYLGSRVVSYIGHSCLKATSLSEIINQKQKERKTRHTCIITIARREQFNPVPSPHPFAQI